MFGTPINLYLSTKFYLNGLHSACCRKLFQVALQFPEGHVTPGNSFCAPTFNDCYINNELAWIIMSSCLFPFSPYLGSLPLASLSLLLSVFLSFFLSFFLSVFLSFCLTIIWLTDTLLSLVVFNCHVWITFHCLLSLAASIRSAFLVISSFLFKLRLAWGLNLHVILETLGHLLWWLYSGVVAYYC